MSDLTDSDFAKIDVVAQKLMDASCGSHGKKRK